MCHVSRAKTTSVHMRGIDPGRMERRESGCCAKMERPRLDCQPGVERTTELDSSKDKLTAVTGCQTATTV